MWPANKVHLFLSLQQPEAIKLEVDETVEFLARTETFPVTSGGPYVPVPRDKSM